MQQLRLDLPLWMLIEMNSVAVWNFSQPLVKISMRVSFEPVFSQREFYNVVRNISIFKCLLAIKAMIEWDAPLEL